MKKIIIFICVIISFVMSSCGVLITDADSSGSKEINIPFIGTARWNSNISFNDEMNSNSFYNMKEGGLITIANNTLYVNFYNDIFAFSDGNFKKLHLDNIPSESRLAPAVFSYDNQLYIYPIENQEQRIYAYDIEKDKIQESNLGVSPSTKPFYISKDVRVFPYQKSNQLMIQYGTKKWTVDEDVSRFDVTDKGIYFTTFDSTTLDSPSSEYTPWEAKLYFHSFQDGKSKLLCTLKNGFVHDLIISGNTCYYNGGGSLYSCSLEDFKSHKLLDDVQSINALNGKVYALTSKNLSDSPGIYAIEKDKTKKLVDISADKIYMFDENHIYTYDLLSYGIHRVNLKDGSVQKILEVNK